LRLVDIHRPLAHAAALVPRQALRRILHLTGARVSPGVTGEPAVSG
jgi:hypothetical protein